MFTSIDALDVYVYHEGERKKGGDNIASFIMQFLTDNGFLDKEKGEGNQLTMLMDNRLYVRQGQFL